MVANIIEGLTEEEKAELAKLLNGQLPPPYADGATQTNTATTAANSKAPAPAASNFKRYGACNKEGLLRDVVDEYIENNRDKLSFAQLIDNNSSICYGIHDEIMQAYEDTRVMMNNTRTKGEATIPPLHSLPAFVAAQLLINTGEIRTAKAGRQSKGSMLIAKHYFKNASTNGAHKWSGQWQMVGTEEGASVLKHIFYTMCPSATEAQFTKEFLSRLFLAPVVYMVHDDWITFWRNGIWDMKQKRGMAYDDPQYEKEYGKYVTLRKHAANHPCLPAWGRDKVCEIDANGNAIVPTYTHRKDGFVWNVKDGLEAPFDMDTEVGQAALKLILQGAQFMVRGRGGRPSIVQLWGNFQGNGANGKSTLMAMFERLEQRSDLGEGDEDLLPVTAVRHIPLEKLEQGYNMNPEDMLVLAANFANESDMSTKPLESSSLIKTLGRGEPVILRQIYGKPMEATLDWVWWVQAINKKAKITERNGSMVRRIDVIPFEKTLDAEGKRDYIITDYAVREETASYLAWLLTCGMEMYDAYDEKARETLAPYKMDLLKDSMTTWQFLDIACETIPLDCLPFEMLFELYVRWAELSNIDKKAVMSAKQFAEDMEQYGCNNTHGVVYSKNHDIVDKRDRENVTYVEALNLYGTSRLLGTSQYVARKKNQNGVEQILPGQINWDMFLTDTKNGKVGKQFTRGVLRRVVSHWDAPIECERIQAAAEAETQAETDKRRATNRKRETDMFSNVKYAKTAAETAAEIYGKPKEPDGGLKVHFD